MQGDVLVGRLFDEWAAAVARGDRPDTLAYLSRAGEHADELARLIERYRRVEARPEPDEELLAATRAWTEGESPFVVLRVRRGLKRDDVVAEIVRAFGLPESRREKVKRYVHELESGALDPTRLQPRLRELVGRLLGLDPGRLAALRPRPIRAAAAFRAPQPAAEAVFSIDASKTREPRDEVDELFLSGRR